MIEQDEFEIEEKHIARVCHDVLEALDYLHENHRIHRDVKSDNMLMDSDGNIKVFFLSFFRNVDTNNNTLFNHNNNNKKNTLSVVLL